MSWPTIPSDRSDDKIIDAGSMTGTDAITSDWFDPKTVASIQAAWTDTPNGGFTVEASNNGGTTATDVSSLITPPLPTVAGAAGNFIVSLPDMGFGLMRLKWTNTSGTGTLNAWTVSR